MCAPPGEKEGESNCLEDYRLYKLRVLHGLFLRLTTSKGTDGDGIKRTLLGEDLRNEL